MKRLAIAVRAAPGLLALAFALRAAPGLLGLAVGCGGSRPSIASFTAAPASISAGQSVTLSWEVRGAGSIALEPGGPQTSAQAVVTPSSTTTYALVATNGHGAARATVTVAVAAPSSQPRIAAVPGQVLPGAQVTLTWDSLAATVTLTADGTSLGDQPGRGSLTVSPAQSALYAIQAGAATAEVRVRVVPAPTISTFAADSASIAAGAAVALRWTSTGATFAVDQGVGYIGAARFAIVRPAQTTTYTLAALGPAGAVARATATVTVAPPAAGTRSLDYLDPAVPSDAALALLKDPSSTSTTLVLRLVTTKAVAAGGLAFDLPIDPARVTLDAARGGDASPGFAIPAGAIEPGPAPLAAKAALGTGRQAGLIVIGLARKATAPGVVPDLALAIGTELLRLRLVAAPGAQPGPALPAAGAVPAFFGHLPRDVAAPRVKLAIGTLSLR